MIPSSVWALGVVFPALFWWVFLLSQLVSSHAITNRYSAKDSKGTLWRRLQFSLCTGLCSLTSGSVNWGCLGFLNLPMASPNSGRLCLGLLLPVLCPGNSFLTSFWDTTGLPLFFLSQGTLSFTACCPVSETHCSILFVQLFSCLRRESNFSKVDFILFGWE